jgi:hypothetical protein
MPRQNRVTPWGDLIATPERGTFMGNRGVLHDAEGHIQRPWQVKRWLVCVLSFRGRKRTVMTPSRYTELFFLDEATALAAGHRPCAECRRERFNAFRAAWQTALGLSSLPTADEIDRRLHTERVGLHRVKQTFVAGLKDLPNGVFIEHDGGEGKEAYLAWDDCLLPWSPGGYTERLARPKNAEVIVVTPRSTVEVIRAGYVPEVQHAFGLPLPSTPVIVGGSCRATTLRS